MRLALHDDDRRKAISWAFGTAKKLGFKVNEEPNMIWVDTGENEIGCLNVDDFVAFMSETVRERRRRAS